MRFLTSEVKRSFDCSERKYRKNKSSSLIRVQYTSQKISGILYFTLLRRNLWHAVKTCFINYFLRCVYRCISSNNDSMIKEGKLTKYSYNFSDVFVCD